MEINTDVYYKDVFKNYNSREKEEKIFYDLTALDLKDFLYKKYAEEHLSINTIAKMFGTSYSTIYTRIKRYGFNRNNYENAIIQRQNKVRTGVYNKTPLDIEVETGRKFVDIVKEHIANGLAPSEIARILKLTNETHIKKVLKETERSDIETVYPDIFKNRKGLAKCDELFFARTGMNLKDFLYQKHVIDGQSTYAIAAIFGCSNTTIHSHLKHYGFARNLSQSRKRLMKDGVINYTDISRKGRETAKKSQSNSNAQDWAREVFKSKFETILLSPLGNNLELIMGYKEWCVLKNKEVDIPIIICDIKTNKFHKISVEYNGNYWHNENSDNDKANSLTESNWKHFIVYDGLSNQKIEEQIGKICDEIIAFVLEYRNITVS